MAWNWMPHFFYIRLMHMEVNIKRLLSLWFGEREKKAFIANSIREMSCVCLFVYFYTHTERRGQIRSGPARIPPRGSSRSHGN